MNHEIDPCDASQTLRKAGLARTPQRLAVLTRLISATGPLSVHDLFVATRGALSIDRVTIYRTLASLRKSGIVREIETGSGPAHYEMACHHNPIHPHFQCRLCGSLTCLPALTLSQAWEWYSRPFNFTLEEISVRLSGVCGPCQQRAFRNPIAAKGDPGR
jgi:Fe2+ or Zn2+ uptake regulation protein